MIQSPSCLSTSLNHYLAWPVQGTAIALQYPLTPILKSLFVESVQKGKAVDYKHYEKTSGDTTALQSGMQFPNGQILCNRLVKSGITDGLCSVNGDPTAEMIAAYKVYARGGFGMIISPDVSISRDSPLPCATGHTPIFDQNSNADAYKALARAMKEGGSAAILQLTHPGTVVAFANKAESLMPAIANHPRGGLSQYAQVLSDREIQGLFETFVSAVKQAENYAFDGAQLVLANGYLPTQFFSNQYVRKGEWEGITFLEKLLTTIVGNKQSRGFTIGIKVNTEDFRAGGQTPKKTAEIVERLSRTGIDFLEVGGGDCEKAFRLTSGESREKFYQDFVLEMGRFSIPTLTVGDWRNVSTMNEAAKQDDCLLIGLGRPACIDPHLGNKILSGEVGKIPNWFRIYFPEWLKKELEKESPDKRMIYGLEVVWHASAVASTARGENPPKIDGIIDAPQHALAVKIHMLLRAIVPRNWLSSYYQQNPFIQVMAKDKNA